MNIRKTITSEIEWNTIKKAQADGKLQELLQVGDTDEDNLCMSTCNRKPDGFCAYRLRNDGADVGKTVFLTREEAEKALEGMKDG